MKDNLKIGGVFTVKCYDNKGRERWSEKSKNLVVNEGLQHILDTVFQSGTPVTNWSIGLTGGTPSINAGDTMASHAGWSEITAYNEATRQAFTSVRTGQQVGNSASVASFAINATTTIGGAFLTSDNTKGGSTGTLFSGSAFAGGDRSAQSGDTLEITYTVSQGAS